MILNSVVFIIDHSLNSVDLDGLGSSEQKSQLLSDHRRLEKAAANITHTPQVLAGMYYVPGCVNTIPDYLLFFFSWRCSVSEWHLLEKSKKVVHD